MSQNIEQPATILTNEMNIVYVMQAIRKRETSPLVGKLNSEQVEHIRKGLKGTADSTEAQKEDWDKFFLKQLREDQIIPPLSLFAHEAHVKRDPRHDNILLKFTSDLEKYNLYLVGAMAGALGDTNNIDDNVLNTQLQDFPKTRAIEILQNLYDNLHETQNILAKLDPTLKLMNPILRLSDYDTKEKKIGALKDAIQKEIGALNIPSSSKGVQNFALELQNQVKVFNENFDKINEKLKEDPTLEAQRLAKQYVVSKILEGVYLGDKNNEPLITNRDERRQIFYTIKDKINISNEILATYLRNQAIIEGGIIGVLVQPIVNRLFGNEKVGHDLRKLKDAQYQEQFVKEVNEIIPKLQDVTNAMEPYKNILSSENYKSIGEKYVSKIANAQTTEDIQQIYTEIKCWLSTKKMVSQAIQNSSIGLDIETTTKIINVVNDKLEKLSPIDDKIKKALVDDLTIALTKHKTPSQPRNKGKIEVEDLSTKDIKALGSALVKKHSKLSPTKTPDVSQKTDRPSSIVGKVTNFFDFTNSIPQNTSSTRGKTSQSSSKPLNNVSSVDGNVPQSSQPPKKLSDNPAPNIDKPHDISATTSKNMSHTMQQRLDYFSNKANAATQQENPKRSAAVSAAKSTRPQKTSSNSSQLKNTVHPVANKLNPLSQEEVREAGKAWSKHMPQQAVQRRKDASMGAHRGTSEPGQVPPGGRV